MTFPLPFINVVEILDTGIKEGIFTRDPKNKDNMLVYMRETKDHPEGWYSQNILSAASDLYNNIVAQKYILNLYNEKGITLNFTKL